MSVARAKGILELLSNKNLTNQEMKELVLDYISDDVTGNPLDVDNMTNNEIGVEFIRLLRQHIKRRAARGAGRRWEIANETAKQTAVEAVTTIADEQ